MCVGRDAWLTWQLCEHICSSLGNSVPSYPEAGGRSGSLIIHEVVVAYSSGGRGGREDGGARTVGGDSKLCLHRQPGGRGSWVTGHLGHQGINTLTHTHTERERERERGPLKFNFPCKTSTELTKTSKKQHIISTARCRCALIRNCRYSTLIYCEKQEADA